MNKNGFTLIEIVSVIAILGIIGVIVFPVVSGIVQNKATELDNHQQQLIIEAAKSYAIDNAFKKENSYTVSVGVLKQNGYLDNTEIKSNNKNYNCSNVLVEKNNNKYTYTFNYVAC